MSNPAANPAYNPVRQRSLDRVRRIVLDRLAGLPVNVYLFGSCATGRAHRFSDIDVAIEPLDDLDPEIVADIEEALEESTVPYFVDVVDLRQAAPELKEEVRREGIQWSP